MKKLMIAIAGAMALTCSAFAEATSWFNGGVGENWPTNSLMSGGAWSNYEDSYYENGKVVIDADDTTPLTFTAEKAKTIGDDADATEVTISSTIKFTPFTELPEVPDDAKAGVVVYKDLNEQMTFYVLAKDGTTNVWSNTEIAATADAFVNISVKIEEDGAATYYLGDSEFETTIATDGKISTANYIGDGEITSLTATYEANIVTFTLPEVAGATITSVTIDGEPVASPYQGKPGAELVVTYKADAGKLFANKTDTYTYEGKVAAGEIPTGIADQGLKDAPAEIDGTLFYTVQDAFNEVEGDETITLLVDVDEAIDNTNDADFTFDLNGKTISSATATATIKQNNEWSGTLTITDSATGGKVINSANAMDMGIAVWARQGDIVIEKGYFENASQYEATIYIGKAKTAAGSTITINGGTFVNTKTYQWNPNGFGTLNVGNDFTDTSALKVYGGTFSTDPALGDDNLGGTFLAEGYASKKVGDVWTVSAAAAKIGSKFYITLQEAFDAAKADQTITLLANVTEEVINTNAVNFTFDLNGKTVTSDATATIKQNAVGSTLTITDGFDGLGKVINTANAMDMGIAVWARQGSVVIQKGYFENASQYEATIYIGKAKTAAGSTITINGGTFVNTKTYQWNPNGFGTLNVGNDFTDTSALKVYGGTFSTDPAKGDDNLGGTFLAENRYSVKSGEYWMVTDQEPEVSIGTTFYLTLNAAVDAAVTGDTIVFNKDVTTTAECQISGKDIVIDLNKKTLFVDEDFQNSGNTSLTVKNGSVKIASGKVNRPYLLRSYGKSLTVENVEIDATGLSLPTKSNADLYTGAILAVSGNVNLTGTTEIKGVASDRYAVSMNRYAEDSRYVPGTLNLGADVKVGGDVLMACGAVSGAKAAQFPEGAKFVIAAGGECFCTADAFAGSGLAGMTGTFPTAKASGSYRVNVTGAAYLTLEAAIAAVDAGGTVSLVDDLTIASLTVDKNCTVDINGKLFTVNGAIALNESVKLVNTKQAGLFAPNGVVTIATEKVLDLSSLPFGPTYYGIQGTGSITITSGAEAKFYAWGVPSVDSANWMYANMPAFFTGSVIPVGGKVTIGDKTWTGTANGFEVPGTVAFAQIDAMGQIGPDQRPIVVNECYTTLAGAAAAVKAGGTVTLVNDCEAGEVVFADKNVDVTLDLNGKTVSATDKWDCIEMGLKGDDENVGTGTLTITGNGRIVQAQDNTSETCEVVWARWGNVVISNGYFEVNGSFQCVYSTMGSQVKIYDGTFKNVTTKTDPGYGDVLNVENSGATTDIQCFGGSYSKDPSLGDDAMGGTFVAEGYASFQDGEMFSVAKLPAITVTDITPAPADLDAAFAYATTDTESAFTGGWKVDFYVSFNANIAENAVMLKGQYGTEEWTGAALPAMTAGVAVPLMQTAGNEVSVEQLLAIKTFNCGVLNVSAPEGTEMTVVLKMYKTATGESFDLATKTYTLAAAKEAKIGTTYYLTLNEALNAATNGATVTLCKDITTAKAQQWNIDKNITIDFADKKITKTVANDWVFTVADGADVVFTGTTGGIVHYPAVLNQGNPASMIQIIGKLTVNGGVYESDFTVLKTDDVGTKASELVVNGGTFTIAPRPGTAYTGPTYAVMNWCTATIKGGTFNGNVVARSYQSQVYPSVITIDGGTFNADVAFNQYGANDTTAGTIKVADGLSVVPTIMKGAEGYKVTSTTETGYTVYTLAKGGAIVIDPTTGEPTEVKIEDIGTNVTAGAEVIIPQAAEQTLVQDSTTGAYTLTVNGTATTFPAYYDVTVNSGYAGGTQYDVSISTNEVRNGTIIEASGDTPAVAMEEDGAITVCVPEVKDDLYYAVKSAASLADVKDAEAANWTKGSDIKKAGYTLTGAEAPAETTAWFSSVVVDDKPHID